MASRGNDHLCNTHIYQALPEQLKTLSMPPNDSLGFYDDPCLLPVASETTKHDPEKAVLCSNLKSFLRTFPDRQLLAERKVFQN